MRHRLWRREFLGFGAAAGGFLLGAAADTPLIRANQEATPQFPWEYRTLDVAAVRARAYRGNFLEVIRDTPYRSFCLRLQGIDLGPRR